MDFSEYVIYVDESGDHNLNSINSIYPIFALAFCIFKKSDYIEQIVPRIQKLKFDWFGHDGIILHERELKKGNPPFNQLGGKDGHQAFLNEISQILREAPMTVISAVINKQKHQSRYSDPANPYNLALMFCMERTSGFLRAHNQLEHKTHIIFEKRGKHEDRDLELEFRRICDGASCAGAVNCLDILFADKKMNSSGLQLADLVAKPIGMHVLKPDQPNRAFHIIVTKLYSYDNGIYSGLGLKVFP